MASAKQKRQRAKFRKSAKICKKAKGNFRACMKKKLKK